MGQCNESARYVGKLVWTPLPDGRLMELVQDFGFIDSLGLEWPVPAKTQVDGASIPQALWSLVGSPFTGKYRDASVIHDYYCDVRIREWPTVHRVFYDAMIVSGVTIPRAKLMYAAVYFAGPRWTSQAVHNNQLKRIDTQDSAQERHSLNDIFFPQPNAPTAVAPKPKATDNKFTKAVENAVDITGITPESGLRAGRSKTPGSNAELHLGLLDQILRRYDPSLEEIASALDQATNLTDPLLPNRSIDTSLTPSDVLSE